ncbi:MAG: hypothetical protein CR961_00610 [Polaribacter sp.]|nr:MAG: hypothetical protein CR961_00610 [Polaribacter sp.]
MISSSYAGIGTQVQLRVNGISQWVGVKDSPDTQSVTLEARLKDQIGGGLTIFNDKNGFTKQMGAKGSVAYHLTLSDFDRAFLSFSLEASYTQFSIDTKDFTTTPDKIETLPNTSNGTVNFGFSTLYRYQGFAISFNVANILDKTMTKVKTKEPLKLRSYSLYPVYTHVINPDYELEPSVFVEYFESDGRIRSDFNIKLRRKIHKGYVWGGLSYSMVNEEKFTSNTISPLLGLKTNNFYVAYGIAFGLNQISEFNRGTHMITLGFDFEKTQSLIRCTQKIGLF